MLYGVLKVVESLSRGTYWEEVGNVPEGVGFIQGPTMR